MAPTLLYCPGRARTQYATILRDNPAWVSCPYCGSLLADESSAAPSDDDFEGVDFENLPDRTRKAFTATERPQPALYASNTESQAVSTYRAGVTAFSSALREAEKARQTSIRNDKSKAEQSSTELVQPRKIGISLYLYAGNYYTAESGSIETLEWFDIIAVYRFLIAIQFSTALEVDIYQKLSSLNLNIRFCEAAYESTQLWAFLLQTGLLPRLEIRLHLRTGVSANQPERDEKVSTKGKKTVLAQLRRRKRDTSEALASITVKTEKGSTSTAKRIKTEAGGSVQKINKKVAIPVKTKAGGSTQQELVKAEVNEPVRAVKAQDGIDKPVQHISEGGGTDDGCKDPCRDNSLPSDPFAVFKGTRSHAKASEQDGMETIHLAG
ncbi:hypothetical protein AUP68_15176 [Ilyonectria robusta]